MREGVKEREERRREERGKYSEDGLTSEYNVSNFEETVLRWQR